MPPWSLTYHTISASPPHFPHPFEPQPGTDGRSLSTPLHSLLREKSPQLRSPSGMGWNLAAPVAADMKKMNENLLSVVGDRHPMLMAAAQQIFGAGGKKLRPMLVFLVAHATAKAGGLTCVVVVSP